MGPGFEGHHHHGGPGWPGDPSFWGWEALFPALLVAFVMLAALVTGALLLHRYGGLGPLGEADASRTRWDGAVARHRRTAEAFARYECDVAAVLRLPALADVTQPATARFVEAFAEAGALLTDAYPGPEYAERFAAAAEHAERAWSAAVESAERVCDARFVPGERALLERVRTLLEVAASSPFEAERRTAYRQAGRKLAELAKRTGWRLPRPAATALEHRSRGMLAAAG